jgi:hypothetical protein
MRMGGIGGATIDPPRRAADRREPPAPETETRALIAIAAPAAADRALPRLRQPAAPFLAQLIATQMQLPQTRARRRAEPDEAVAVYGSLGPKVITGRTVRQA